MYQYLAQIGVSLAAKQTADARRTCGEMLTKIQRRRLLSAAAGNGFIKGAVSKLFPVVKTALEQAEQHRMRNRTTRKRANFTYIM